MPAERVNLLKASSHGFSTIPKEIIGHFAGRFPRPVLPEMAQREVYRVLVKNGPLNASEIAFLSHMPRPKAYGALRLLERKGLIHVVPSNPKTFSAASPRAILKVKADELTNQSQTA